VATSPEGGATIVVRIPLAASPAGLELGPPAPERSPQLH
jgi:hypothetical protein